MISKRSRLSKFILIASLFAIQSAQALTVSGLSKTDNPSASINGNRSSGVVSKIANGQIEINAVTYDFTSQKPKVFDTNGSQIPSTEIKVGMFVNILVVVNQKKASIVELKVVRK